MFIVSMVVVVGFIAQSVQNLCGGSYLLCHGIVESTTILPRRLCRPVSAIAQAQQHGDHMTKNYIGLKLDYHDQQSASLVESMYCKCDKHKRMQYWNLSDGHHRTHCHTIASTHM